MFEEVLRSLWASDWFRALKASHRYILMHCIAKAAFHPTTPGRFTFTYRGLADECGVGVQELRTVLAKSEAKEYLTQDLTQGRSALNLVPMRLSGDAETPNNTGPNTGPPAASRVRGIGTLGSGSGSGKKRSSTSRKFTDIDLQLANWILDLILALKPNFRRPNLEAWANDIRLMRERDGRTHREIAVLFRWANNDEFWRVNILSPATLRKQWDRLELKMGAANTPVKPTGSNEVAL